MRVPLGPPRFVPLTAMSQGYVDAGDARRVALFASVALILDLGIFPSFTLEFAHASVEGPGARGESLLGMAP